MLSPADTTAEWTPQPGDRVKLKGCDRPYCVYTVERVREAKWKDEPWMWAELRSHNGDVAHWQLSQLEKINA